MTDDFQFDVFLSHNAKDKPRVPRLAQRLKQAGLRVWFDERNDRSGDIIALEVDEGLDQSRVLLLYTSRMPSPRSHVSLERSPAIYRNPSNEGPRFIPDSARPLGCRLWYNAREWHLEIPMNTNEKERNLRIAEALCRDFQWEGRTFHEGECVALLDGNIVAVAGNPDDAIAALRALDPDPKRGMVVQIAPPTVDVIR